MELKKPNDGKPKMDFEVKVGINKDKAIKGVKIGKSFIKKIIGMIFNK
jgi:hypothetical protein